MKHLRKSILTLLALTLFGGAGAWAQTEENIFQYCYDCQRSPAYPKTTASASLSGFENPYVGYKGIGFEVDNTSAGPWKLEYVGLWSTTDKHGIEDIWNYQDTYNCTDVPVFRLYQWNATANEYQHAAYGVVCAYAKVSNAVEHTAFFEAEGGWGCVLTNSSHSSSMNITFDEDLTTGITALIAAATPAAQEIELTKKGANQWSLGQTPDYDLELQVEYYQKYALKNIPAGWQVMVNGVDKTAAIDGDSLLITETDSVTLIPDNPRRVKSVTLVDNSTPPAVYLEATTTAWADGINYAVPAEGLTYGDAVTVSGNVTLTLTEGTTLTLNKGISMASGATLTVEGTGTMAVNGTNNSAASTVAGSGTLVMTSGTLTAKGGNGESLTINYIIPAHNIGASGGVAINGNVTVSGGTVTATGGNGGNLNTSAAGGELVMDNRGGNGGAAISGSVTVNAGTWTATNGSNGTYTSVPGDYDCSAGTGGAAVAGTVTDNR